MSRLPSALAPAPIQLTPSLSRLYKEQLIGGQLVTCDQRTELLDVTFYLIPGHVLAWPAEPVERVINKVSEDANQISNHAITKVSQDKWPRQITYIANATESLSLSLPDCKSKL